MQSINKVAKLHVYLTSSRAGSSFHEANLDRG